MADETRKRLGFLLGEKGVGPAPKLAHSYGNQSFNLGRIFLLSTYLVV